MPTVSADTVLQLRSTTRYVVFWLSYLALCWAGGMLTLAPEYGVSLWPASGVFMSVLARARRSELPTWLMLGASADLLASVLLFGFPVAVAVPVAVGNALEASIGAFLLRHWTGQEFKLQDTRDALVFAVCGGGVAPLASMVMGGTAVALHTGTPVLESWRLWWTGDAVGVVVIAPILLAARDIDWARIRKHGTAERFDAAALAAATLILGYLCLGQTYPVTFLTLPLVIWAAMRYGVIGSSLVTALLVVQAVLYARAGVGPFATHLSVAGSQSALQAFGIVTALTGLLLAVTIGQAWRLKALAEREVALRTAELHQRELQLESALGELRQADRRKDHFVAALAHEVLNPIAAMSNGLALLDRKLPETQQGSVRVMMKRQLDLLTMLGRDLLELARIKSGKVHLELKSSDLSALVLGAASAVQDRMAVKGQTLQVDLPPAGTCITCDEKRLMQVLTNLLANAHRHCPDGTDVRLAACADAGGVTISVEDNGPGIPEEQLTRIFSRFEQLDDRSVEGLGLGLALAKQLVELHGGRLEVRSSVGVGTTFVVALPTG